MGKIGRNERCPCGSGKKYKRCCLGKDAPVKALPDSAERAPVQVTSPTRPRPEPFAGMTAYVIAKFFEDSEQFARMKRLEPEKALPERKR
jgi:hypothetical protein